MFYDIQPQELKEKYKKMLTIIGNLTLLFSESECPYLPYRCHENIFCKYLEAENLARSDCSADAKKENIGIGLKTWMGNDDQKVAEFGRLRKNYENLSGIELVKKIAEYRNERIRVTKNLHGIDKMIYHIVKRIPNSMQILESTFDYINIGDIKLIKNRGNVNNTYFTDGKHTYHFSTSKNTLYMIFDDMELLDSFEVEIMTDPYSFLLKAFEDKQEITKGSINRQINKIDKKNSICLRLYSLKSDGTKFVPEKSGLNQWNASGRKRDSDEIYIPYPKPDRERTKDFFPPRYIVFNLKLPDGDVIQAKICQDDGKAIMSNPNKVLGKWLLRKVFEIPKGTLVTYQMLKVFGIDSVIIRKEGELEYSIDFAEVGTYEQFYSKDIE